VGLVVLEISMSLDGFITAPDDAAGRGLGTGGEALHNWVFGGPWSYDEPHELATTGVDKEVLDEAMRAAVSVIGRRMYDIVDGWGGDPPGAGPCIVVTHRVEDQPEPPTRFEFVDGVEPALARAQELAGDGATTIGGGADVAQQALQAGLVDELSIHVAPVLLGGGRTLFGTLGTRLTLERVRVLDSPHATHVRYRVVR
jgi:dihydrofolate reductase